MKRIKKTKIIATLGPSSSSKDYIEMLIKEGADVLRINFSHSTHKEAKSLINDIRKINEEFARTNLIRKCGHEFLFSSVNRSFWVDNTKSKIKNNRNLLYIIFAKM